MYEGRLLIARIQKSVGFKGEVKAELLTDFPERFTQSFVCAVHKEENPDPQYFLDAEVEEESATFLDEPDSFLLSHTPLRQNPAYKAGSFLEINSEKKKEDENPNSTSPVRFLRVKNASLANTYVRIAFAGIETKEEADTLRGCFISLDPSEAKDLPEGRWYKRDLFDLQVYDLEGNFLGNVKEVLSYPASDLIQVSKEGENDLLIPFVENMVKKVDVDNARILVDLPEGFIEVYRS